MYAFILEERERTMTLRALGIEDDKRSTLDNDLMVRLWRTDDEPLPKVDDDGAPSWWGGDEDASASFLGAMGVRLD